MTLSRLLCFGLVLLALGGCDRRAAVESPPGAAISQESRGGDSVPAVGAGEAAGETVEDGGFRSTPIHPIRTANLSTEAAGARVNLRSQPTTESELQGYGLDGDPVTLLRLAEGEGGFNWYYVKFAQSKAEGWVRGDFIGTAEQAAGLAPHTAADINTGSCGESNRPEAFFETKSFTVHLCQTPRGLSYIGINKTNNETLSTADVRQEQGTYIAINGNYQYHINDNNLAVYQVSSGNYSQLENEDVVRHERFLY